MVQFAPPKAHRSKETQNMKLCSYIFQLCVEYCASYSGTFDERAIFPLQPHAISTSANFYSGGYKNFPIRVADPGGPSI